LAVFCGNNKSQYQSLIEPAKRLGAAFQKINFLRDLNADYMELGRTYFPEVDIMHFDVESKRKIELEILKDFQDGLDGIKGLPKSSRFGVYLAYVYFFALFKRIQATPPNKVLKKRIRVANVNKFGLLAKSYLRHQFNLL
jgi:phytoene/squalene synthetase